MNIIFFGSFQHYSTLILESLYQHDEIDVVGVVTTPPKPAGRKKELKKTHTHIWAEKHNIPVFTPDKLDNSALENLKSIIKHPDHIVVAGYGKKLPDSWLDMPNHGCLNIHFSLLPKYRGANPAEWAILTGETLTGISLITMSFKIDTGDIITQKETKIDSTDTRESLYQKLYASASTHGPDMILKYFKWLQKNDTNCQTSLAPRSQGVSPTPYARLLKRADGYISWNILNKAIHGKTLRPTDFGASLFGDICTHLNTKHSQPLTHKDLVKLLNRASRALFGFPGLWTTITTNNGDRRLKIHSTSIYKDQLVLETVQLEGQSLAHFNQIKNIITS